MIVSKYILLWFILGNIHFSAIGQPLQNSLQELGLYGSIESVLTERYKIMPLSGKKIKKEKDCFDGQSYCSSFFFDRKGMLIQEFEHDNEDMINTNKSTYNSEGYKINYDSFSKEKDTFKQTYHRLFTYNKDNQLEIFSVYIGKGTLGHKIIYQYNDLNQKTDAFNYNAKGVLVGKYTYDYDQYGNKTKEQVYDYQLLPTFSIQYHYDSITHLKTHEIHYSGDSLTFQRIFIYNTDMQLVELKEIDVVNKTENKTTYQYNLSRHLTEEVNYYNSQLSKRILYAYDHQNNRIKENVYYKDNNKWILKYIIEHTIKYY